jgi:hypothetical protein
MRAWVPCLIFLSAGCDSTFRQFTVDTGFGPIVGTDSGVESDWYCDQRQTQGRCVQYVGSGWDAPGRDSDCAAGAMAGTCPTSDLGGCTRGPKAPLARTEWYYSGDYYSDADVQSLEASCLQDYGLWIGSATGT